MIGRLRKFRKDGKVIEEGMSVAEVAELGPISLVIRIAWTFDGLTLERSSEFGIFADVLPGRDALVCIERQGDDESDSLRVINGDGTTRFEIPRIMEIRGTPLPVRFNYTYPKTDRGPQVFAVVVTARRLGDSAYLPLSSDFKAFIDSRSGEILEAVETR